MDLLNRLRHALEIKRQEQRTIHELSQLSDRALADLGLSRADIRDVAWVAARADGIDVYQYDTWRDAREAIARGLARTTSDRRKDGSVRRTDAHVRSAAFPVLRPATNRSA
jgi:uncharacterized protein YjiS (DUF1127 family)